MSFHLNSRQHGIYHNTTPVFNKRVFKAQAGIVLTEDILKILNRPLKQERSQSELHKLKSVVNGLKEIHKGFQFVKDALSFVVGYERIEPHVKIKRQPTESGLSCYYILTGSIEAKYSLNNSDSDQERKGRKTGIDSLRGKSKDSTSNQSDDCIITYTHIAGDYLGLVSGDGEEYDLPPPQSIKTLEICEFLRIDRNKFHQAVRAVHSQYVQEVEQFINSESILRYLPEKERERLVPLMAKQEYGAGKVIVNQGAVPDHIFFIGKGEVFGESSVLGGSPSFCSVTSMGQVMCFLINKWVIKTNEHVLNLLREHQHYFYEDDMILHFIKDSDVWQSYKRSKVVELLDATNRQFIAVEKKDVQEILETALSFGDAKRCHSSQASKSREAGEPVPQVPLFVVPRSRRRSSAILHSNAAAVVKAVLLLRRNTDETKSDIRLPEIRAKSQRAKPASAPSRYRSRATSPLNSTKDFRLKKTELKNSHKDLSFEHRDENRLKDCRPKSVPDIGRQSGVSRTRPNSGENAKKRQTKASNPSVLSTKIKTTRTSQTDQRKQRKETTPNEVRLNDSKTKLLSSDPVEHKSHSGQGIEKYVSSSRHFIIKEIINTGNPKRQSSPQRYHRFDNSMFTILDNQKDDAKKRTPSPWGISFAASKWMAGIRRKRLQTRNEEGMTPSPTPPPLIVIEEYAPQNISSDEQTSDDDSCDDPLKLTNNIHTPSPSLEQLEEERDEDIVEYNKLEAGKPLEKK
ncbi:hypothetical protein QZH41_001732 [Actinostola sp. cb2023]|nr:hypothetical protein QZH41_001732 [Actinostola sp. cb2023]